MSGMEGIRVVETSAVGLEKPTILIGLPDVGLVGMIAAMHMLNTQKMQDIAYIESDLIPPIVVLHGGKIFEPIRVYGQNNLLLITSEIPIPGAIVRPFARSIVKWSMRKNPQLILALGGIAVPNRLDIEKPECYTIETNEEAKRILEKAKLERLNEGIMVGPYPIILRECQKNNLPAATILAQSFDKYPDPGAAASVIEVLGKLLNINVNIDELLKSAEEIRVKTRDLMRRTDRTMQQMSKAQELEVPAMYT